MGESKLPRNTEQVAKSVAQTILFGLGNHKPEGSIPNDVIWSVSFEQVWRPIKTMLDMHSLGFNGTFSRDMEFDEDDLDDDVPVAAVING